MPHASFLKASVINESSKKTLFYHTKMTSCPTNVRAVPTENKEFLFSTHLPYNAWRTSSYRRTSLLNDDDGDGRKYVSTCVCALCHREDLLDHSQWMNERAYYYFTIITADLVGTPAQNVTRFVRVLKY